MPPKSQIAVNLCKHAQGVLRKPRDQRTTLRGHKDIPPPKVQGIREKQRLFLKGSKASPICTVLKSRHARGLSLRFNSMLKSVLAGLREEQGPRSRLQLLPRDVRELGHLHGD